MTGKSCGNTRQHLRGKRLCLQMLPMVGLGLWHAMSEGRLALELHTQPDLAKRWRHIAKKVRTLLMTIRPIRSQTSGRADRSSPLPQR